MKIIKFLKFLSATLFVSVLSSVWREWRHNNTDNENKTMLLSLWKGLILIDVYLIVKKY